MRKKLMPLKFHKKCIQGKEPWTYPVTETIMHAWNAKKCKQTVAAECTNETFIKKWKTNSWEKN